MANPYVLHPVNGALEVTKAAPSVGAVLIGWLQTPVEQWALVMGLIFIMLQMAHLLWRWWRDLKHERQRDNRIASNAMTDTDRAPL